MLYKAAVVGAAWLLMGEGVALAQDTDVLHKASQLISKRDYAAAYGLLEPVESDHSGNPEYDMLFGLAAIDSGHVTRGVFALERVLALQPDNANARAQIARAYFLLGEQDAARAEFRNVLNQQPPEDISKVINRYMSAIDKAQGLKTSYSAYLEGTVGHDSNVNSATTAASVAVPGIANNLDLVLSRASRAAVEIRAKSRCDAARCVLRLQRRFALDPAGRVEETWRAGTKEKENRPWR